MNQPNDNNQTEPPIDPGERFRRLISSSENHEIANSLETNADSETSSISSEEKTLEDIQQNTEESGHQLSNPPVSTEEPSPEGSEVEEPFNLDEVIGTEELQEYPAGDLNDEDQIWQERYEYGTSPIISTFPAASFENEVSQPFHPSKEKVDPGLTRPTPIHSDEITKKNEFENRQIGEKVDDRNLAKENVSMPGYEKTPPPPGATKPFIPRTVSEFDTQATRVSRSAYGQNQNSQYQPTQQRITENVKPQVVSKNRKKNQKVEDEDNGNFFQQSWGCLVRLVITLLFIMILGIIILGSIGVYQYFNIASGLPSVDDLKARAATFETTRILDRNGNVIYENS